MRLYLPWLLLLLLDVGAVVFRPRKLHLVSFGDTRRKEICYLASTAFHFGSPIHMLGWHKSTHFFDGTTCRECHKAINYGHAKRRKMYWLKHYVQHADKLGLHEDDLLLFADSHDVLFQRNLSSLISRFETFLNHQRGVIFNGEMTCGASFNSDGEYGRHIRNNRTYEVQLTTNSSKRRIRGRQMCSMVATKTALHYANAGKAMGPYWSLNSGAFVGDVLSLQKTLQAMENLTMDFEHHGDQIIFHRAYLKYPELNFVVDTRAELFYAGSFFLHDNAIAEVDTVQRQCSDQYMIANGVPGYHAFTQTTPFVIHFPGIFRPYLHSCAEKLIQFSRKEPSKRQYFYDVDRQQKVYLDDLCSHIFRQALEKKKSTYRKSFFDVFG